MFYINFEKGGIINTEVITLTEKNKQPKFIVTPKTEKSVTMTIRLEAETNRKLEALSIRSGRSRNELINKALLFALNNLEFME